MFGHSLVGTVSSNPAGAWMSRLLRGPCFGRSIPWADYSSRGVLQSLECVSVIVKPRKRGGPEGLGLLRHGGGGRGGGHLGV